jgi:protein-disulfide isomerase
MKKLFPLLLMLFVASCSPSKDSLKKMLKENPDILTDAIAANPAEFIEALNAAVKDAQGAMAKKREEEEKKQLEDAFNNPLKAEIRKDELIRGTKGAPITLIEYSDFECPFCSRGYKTVLELLKKYEGKIQFVYKHLPLSFHPQAMISSQYYEAARIQSEKKAIALHDAIYENQKKLVSNGEKFLKAEAKKLGLDMGKLAKDIKSEAVQKRIDADQQEAAKFGFRGTPGFLLNGIPVKGAYPVSHFEDLIKQLESKGKIKL